MEGVWILALLTILAHVGVDHREYFHDDFSELRATVVVKVLFVFNKSGKLAVVQLESAAISYRGSNVLIEHTLRHSRHCREIRPVVYDLVSGKRTTRFFVNV